MDKKVLYLILGIIIVFIVILIWVGFGGKGVTSIKDRIMWWKVWEG